MESTAAPPAPVGPAADPYASPLFSTPTEPEAPYRTLSTAAIASVIFAVLASAGLIVGPLLVLALFGAFLGWSALRRIRAYPRELYGAPLARLGLGLNLLLGIGGLAYHVYAIATEAPEGYAWKSWRELQPDPARPDLPISPKSVELNGRKIYLKGYVHPSSGTGKLQRFVMVPDMGTCCFGGQPKLTDMVLVELSDPLYVHYGVSKRGIGGVFRLNETREKLSGDLVTGFYRIEADFLK